MNHQDIENSKNISVTQEGGAVQIEGVRLQYINDAFNSYNLTLNVLLPSDNTIDAVSINKLLKIKLKCNKSIIDYGENLPECSLNNTSEANRVGLCFQIYNVDNAQFIPYIHDDNSFQKNPFTTIGKYSKDGTNVLTGSFTTDSWEFDFFVTKPASNMGNNQSIITDIPVVKNELAAFQANNQGKTSYCVLTLLPTGWIKVTIKNLRIQPDVSSIEPPQLRLTFNLINDPAAASAKANELVTRCLNNAKDYERYISSDKQMAVNTSITVYNPISSQSSILEKFGESIFGDNKSLYQLLYMYFFIGINCDSITTALNGINAAKGELCSSSASKRDFENTIIKYSTSFDPLRIQDFVYFFTQIMTINLDQNPKDITINILRQMADKEIRLNPKKKLLMTGGGTNDNTNIVPVSQDGGADNEYLAYAKIIPMQISDRKTGPNDMIVTITQLTKPCENSDSDEDADAMGPPDSTTSESDENDSNFKLNKIDISVGDAIRFVKDGKIVYGVICGFKAGKKKYLGGNIESNTNIQDYWTSSASFVGEDAESELYKLKIDEIVSIINLRGIIYVEFEYENDNEYPYCENIDPEKGKGKIKFNCNIDKDLWMLPNGYNPSAIKSFAKGFSAFADSFKIGKSTPFGLGNYGKIQYSLRAYMTLDKVNLPSNFKEFSKDLKQLQPYGVNNNYIPQLGGLINKYSLNDDCGRYGMKMTDVASLQIASNFKRKVDETNRNYSSQMQPSGFDIVKSNKFISDYLLNNTLSDKELQDTIYGTSTSMPATKPQIPKLIYGLMLKSPDSVTSMKLIFSALSVTDDGAIQKIIDGIRGKSTPLQSVDSSFEGGASGSKIKDLIDALIDIIRSQKLLDMRIIDQLSSGLESAFSQSHDPESLKTSLASLAKVSKSGQFLGIQQKITSAASALASQGSALTSQGSPVTNMMKSLFSSSGQPGTVSIGSGSCGDAKVMCDENGIIQVQINLQDLLNNCFPSNGVVGEENSGNLYGSNISGSSISQSGQNSQQQQQQPPSPQQQQPVTSASVSIEPPNNNRNSGSESQSIQGHPELTSLANSTQTSLDSSSQPISENLELSDSEKLVKDAYIRYYNLYGKVDDKAQAGGTNDIDELIQVGGVLELEDYIQGDALPLDSVDTKNTQDPKYKDVCSSELPVLCGTESRQAGYCRKNEYDCIVENFAKIGSVTRKESPSYIYRDPDFIKEGDNNNNRYNYRPYSSDDEKYKTILVEQIKKSKEIFQDAVQNAMPIGNLIKILKEVASTFASNSKIYVNVNTDIKKLESPDKPSPPVTLNNTELSLAVGQFNIKLDRVEKIPMVSKIIAGSKAAETNTAAEADTTTGAKAVTEPNTAAEAKAAADATAAAEAIITSYKEFYEKFTGCVLKGEYPHESINPNINTSTYISTLTNCFSDINTNDVLRNFFETILNVSLNNHAMNLGSRKTITADGAINHELLLLIVNNLRPDDIKDMIKDKKLLNDILTSLTAMLNDDTSKLMKKIIEKFKQQSGGRYRKKNHNSNSKSKSKKNKKSSKRKTKKMAYYKSKSKKVRFVKTS